jgi:hypothetical protein
MRGEERSWHKREARRVMEDFPFLLSLHAIHLDRQSSVLPLILYWRVPHHHLTSWMEIDTKMPHHRSMEAFTQEIGWRVVKASKNDCLMTPGLPWEQYGRNSRFVHAKKLMAWSMKKMNRHCWAVALNAKKAGPVVSITSALLRLASQNRIPAAWAHVCQQRHKL